MTPGTRITHRHVPSQAGFDRFAALSGDDNPIHTDPGFAARSRFGRTVSHGMLLYAVVWGLLRRRLGGGRQLAQSLMFPNPAFAGEPLDVAIACVAAEGGLLRFGIEIRRVDDGAIVLTGEATWASRGESA